MMDDLKCSLVSDGIFMAVVRLNNPVTCCSLFQSLIFYWMSRWSNQYHMGSPEVTGWRCAVCWIVRGVGTFAVFVHERFVDFVIHGLNVSVLLPVFYYWFRGTDL